MPLPKQGWRNNRFRNHIQKIYSLFAEHYYDKRQKLTKILIKSARFEPVPVQNGRFG
jgi:hypothetical protein